MNRTMTNARLWAWAFGVMLAGAASAQVIIIEPPWPGPPHPVPPRWPEPPREIRIERPFEMTDYTVDARIVDQMAEVRVNQTLYNPNSRDLEVDYLFPLPETGTVQDFVLLADGQEIPGELMDRDQARSIYEGIVRRRKDPALLEYVGRGLLRARAFPVPAGGKRTLTLRYNQLLPRDGDVIDFSYPLSLKLPGHGSIGRLAVDVRLRSSEQIKSVYSPTHDVTVKRDGEHEASVRFQDTGVRSRGDFRLLTTVEAGEIGASLVSYRSDGDEDGYFLLMASPRVEAADQKPVAKTVVFVLDRSGSMNGKNIEQAREALRFVLNNLREGDTFNIVAYDDRVETFEPELQRYSAETREAALRYVDAISPGGSTNIGEALRTTLEMLQPGGRPAYVLFLTDGLPTAGETNELGIAQICRKANDADARIFSFGVGYQVNSRLLDRISADNSGATQFVRPDENIESAVSSFYSKMSSPVMTGLELALGDRRLDRVYPRDLPDLFAGGQLVVVGRYGKPGEVKVRLSGSVGEEPQTLEFDATLAKAGENPHYQFVERLWATRRIGDLIDQIDLHGKNRELVDELTRLSSKYGILTPYTAFLADERKMLASARGPVRGEVMREAEERLVRLESVSGETAQADRRMKSAMMTAGRAAPAAVMSGSRAAMGGSGRGGVQADSSMAWGSGYAMEGEPRETIRVVADKTFFWKQDGWLDSEAAGVEDEPVRIELYSEAYFELLGRLASEQLRYLVFDEPVTMLLDGKLYRFEPASP